jgi:hypothetical protein
MLEEILLVNEKTGEYDFELGLCACFRCNVTPKNVKTKKIFRGPAKLNLALNFLNHRFKQYNCIR